MCCVCFSSSKTKGPNNCCVRVDSSATDTLRSLARWKRWGVTCPTGAVNRGWTSSTVDKQSTAICQLWNLNALNGFVVDSTNGCFVVQTLNSLVLMLKPLVLNSELSRDHLRRCALVRWADRWNSCGGGTTGPKKKPKTHPLKGTFRMMAWIWLNLRWCLYRVKLKVLFSHTHCPHCLEGYSLKRHCSHTGWWLVPSFLFPLGMRPRGWLGLKPYSRVFAKMWGWTHRWQLTAEAEIDKQLTAERAYSRLTAEIDKQLNS